VSEKINRWDERTRAQTEKKPRPRTKNARRPVVAFTVSNGIPAIENRRQKTRRPRSRCGRKEKYLSLITSEKHLSPKFVHTTRAYAKKIKKQQKQSPAVPVRASVRDGLSERRNRSSGLCGRGKHYACLFVTFAFIYIVYISRARFSCFIGKKNPPLLRRFFFLFFERAERDLLREEIGERDLFFALNPKP